MKRWVWPLLVLLVACSGTSPRTTEETTLPSTVSSGAIESTSSSLAIPVPQPGDAGLGDSLHPALGNSGYDVGHYALDLTFDGDRLEGTATVTMRPTVLLESFYLDLTGMEVESVTVDGMSVSFEVGDELLVFPDSPLAEGVDTEVVIGYGVHPERRGSVSSRLARERRRLVCAERTGWG